MRLGKSTGTTRDKQPKTRNKLNKRRASQSSSAAPQSTIAVEDPEVPYDSSEGLELSPEARRHGLALLAKDVLARSYDVTVFGTYKGPWDRVATILSGGAHPGWEPYSDDEIVARLRREGEPAFNHKREISDLERALDGQAPTIRYPSESTTRKRVLRHIAHGEPLSPPRAKTSKTDMAVAFFDRLLRAEPGISAREAQSRAYRELKAGKNVVEGEFKG